jgi:hypothetical protein
MQVKLLKDFFKYLPHFEGQESCAAQDVSTDKALKSKWYTKYHIVFGNQSENHLKSV